LEREVFRNMTEHSRFWDGTTVGDATEAPYDAGNELAQVLSSVCGAAQTNNNGGVFNTELNMLAVTGAASPVTVASGRALVAGTWYENDAATTVAIPTPASSWRVDYIVLRKTWASKTVRITRIAGIEGAGIPALTQTDGVTWDVPLYRVYIGTDGVISLTDAREFLPASNSVIGQVDTADLADGILSADETGRAKMADAYIILSKLADALFTADGSGRGKFAANFIIADLITAGAVTEPKLADNAASTRTIPDGAVTPAKESTSPFCQLRLSSQTLTTGTPAVIAWAIEDNDTDTMWDVGTPGKIYAKTKGIYNVSATIRFQFNAAGTRSVAIYKSGVAVTEMVLDANRDATNPITVISLSHPVSMAVNDYIEIVASQDSGGNLNVEAGGSNQSLKVVVARVGQN
jgi:hypothetical protein